ncbi:MAG: S9 family peptidase [Pseudomonadota bacterium]
MLVSPIDRRRLLRQGVLAGAALPLLSLWPAGRAAAEIEPVPRRVFFDNPDIGSVSVSPDGWTLAWLAPVDGVRNLFVARIDDLNSARPVTRVTDRNLAPFYRWAHTNRHIVFFQERDGDENWRASSVDIRSGAIVPLSPPQGVRSFIQEIDRKFPTDMLIRHNQRDKRFFDLYRVNILNGASDLLYENTEYTGLLTDGDFQLRLGVRFAKDGSAEVLERHASGSWSPFATVPVGDVDGMRLLDFSPDGHTLYFIDARGRDKAALFAMDMATRKTTLLAADEEADIVGVNFFSRRPVAAMSYRERARWHAVDASMVQDLADLGASSGGGDIEILGRTYGNRIVTAYFEHDTASGEYALLDRETHEVRPLFKQRTALAGVALQKLEPVVIPARDGLRLNGYLTRPVDAPPGKAPMVLVIHGGPYARDAWGFNPTHQWLANRGYAVLSVNYRGSTGFGKAFVTAADREWGGRMHDDLIDAVDWAVAQGIADPARVGFYGASYGGYSALTAATKTPDKFACIVDLFGISNLKTFMATIPSYWGPWFSIWKQRLGDPATEEGRAFLTERSPLTHIDRATRPILIAQGLKDVRVVAAESEQMVAALKSRGVPVTYVTFSDEGHGFVRPANRLAFYAVAEAFLGKHLGGRTQPVGDDFKGSTLKVETGGEHVPGLAG